MSLVNISLDTKTRQIVLAVDGVLVQCESCGLDKWVDDYDGEKTERISFYYTVVVDNGLGMKETRRFYLPDKPLADASAEVEEESQPDTETGLVSEVVKDPIKADDEDIQKDLNSIFDRENQESSD